MLPHTSTPRRARGLPALLLLLTRVAVVVAAAAALEECKPAAADDDADAPWHIHPVVRDPAFSRVVVDSTTTKTLEEGGVVVAAHFANATTANVTDTEIRLYLPPRASWRRRLFQYVYPSNPAEATAAHVRFALASGAGLVQIRGFGNGAYRPTRRRPSLARRYAAAYYGDGDGDGGDPEGGEDADTARVNNNSSNNSSKIHAYIFGGSGGSFQTIGAMENTVGVWDGAVPFIQATPVSLPLDICVRALVGLVVGPGDRAARAAVIDAARPGSGGGGGGAPLHARIPQERDANGTLRGALREATAMGVPEAAWEDFDTVAGAASLALLMSNYKKGDPTYNTDFWTLPGYLGTEATPMGDAVRAALVNHTAVVVGVSPASPAGSGGNGVVVQLDPLPPALGGKDTSKVEMTLLCRGREDGDAGTALSGTLNATSSTLVLDDGSTAVTKGCRVRLDNSWFVAMSSYHRHALPPPDMGFYGLDWLRNASTGQPLYPQRPVDMSRDQARRASGGGTHTGRIPAGAKMIVVDNLVDSDAFPWQADWYRGRVSRALRAEGGADLDDSYRLWYTEHANHDYPTHASGELDAQLVNYGGVIEQALRDLARWVEEGVAPPASTRYDVAEWAAQIIVPGAATERAGVQPVVSLAVAGGRGGRAVAGRGDSVVFDVRAEVPPGAGFVVSLEWDPVGSGNFTSHPLVAAGTERVATTTLEHRYNSSGTFFPVVRVTSQREGDPTTPFGRVANLGRTRVVVS